MRYLFFTNTPAHVHLYRNAVSELLADGHEVEILAREYGCTTALLDWFDLPYSVYGRCETTKSSLLRQLPRQYARIVSSTLGYDPDLIFGVGAYAAHAGAVSRTPTILLHDSEPTTLDHLISRPFASAILTPASFRKDLGSDHYVFDGFMETAYLHPDAFEADPDVRDHLGVDDDERYAIVRFNAFGSHHDVGRSGFTPEQRRRLVRHLAERVTVFVSDESGEMDLSALPAHRFDLHPALLHDALASADLLVADTQTVVTEAALLGTPAVRSNSFVGDGDMGNFVDLANAGLVENVAEFDRVIERTAGLLDTDGTRSTWRDRRDEFLAEMVDLTDVIVDVAKRPDSLDRVDELRAWSSSTGSVPARDDRIDAEL